VVRREIEREREVSEASPACAGQQRWHAAKGGGGGLRVGELRSTIM
jgi:hypothetical protein